MVFYDIMKKKSQISLEFMVIFGFLIFLMLGIIGVVNYYSNMVKKDIDEKEIIDFSSSIKQNIETLSRLEPGVIKEVVIEKGIRNSFDINISRGYLIVKTEHSSFFDETYFEIPTNVEIELMEKSNGDLIIKMYKEAQTFEDRISIENIETLIYDFINGVCPSGYLNPFKVSNIVDMTHTSIREDISNNYCVKFSDLSFDCSHPNKKTFFYLNNKTNSSHIWFDKNLAFNPTGEEGYDDTWFDYNNYYDFEEICINKEFYIDNVRQNSLDNCMFSVEGSDSFGYKILNCDSNHKSVWIEN